MPEQAHGVLMVVSIVILLPISAAIARTMRGTWGPSLWFQLHRAFGVCAQKTLLFVMKCEPACMLPLSCLQSDGPAALCSRGQQRTSSVPDGCFWRVPVEETVCGRGALKHGNVVSPQVVATSAIIAGFGLGVKLWVLLSDEFPRLLAAHVGIGIAVVTLVMLQALALVARPKPGARLRCSRACR